MPTTYRAVMLTKKGGPEALDIVELPVEAPGPTQLRVRVTGAAGGVGTAALQLLRRAGVKAYGAASAAKHATARSLGAIPIDYRAGPLDRLIQQLEPEGVDCGFDAVGGSNISPCIG